MKIGEEILEASITPIIPSISRSFSPFLPMLMFFDNSLILNQQRIDITQIAAYLRNRTKPRNCVLSYSSLLPCRINSLGGFVVYTIVDKFETFWIHLGQMNHLLSRMVMLCIQRVVLILLHTISYYFQQTTNNPK